MKTIGKNEEVNLDASLISSQIARQLIPIKELIYIIILIIQEKKAIASGFCVQTPIIEDKQILKK